AGRRPNARRTGMNQRQGEAALGEDKIGQPDSDQDGNIVQSSTEACPRGNRMSVRYGRSHRLKGRALDNEALDNETLAKALPGSRRDRTCIIPIPPSGGNGTRIVTLWIGHRRATA